MDRARFAASLRIIVAAGIVLAVVLLAGDAIGWGGAANAQGTVPTAPPSNTPVPPPPPSKTPLPPAPTKTFTPTVTLTPVPTKTAAPTTVVPPTDTETPIAAPPTSVPSPTPVPTPSPLPIPPWCIGGLALAVLLLLIAAWFIARRRGRA